MERTGKKHSSQSFASSPDCGCSIRSSTAWLSTYSICSRAHTWCVAWRVPGCTLQWGGPPCLPDDVYTVAGIDRELRLEDVLVKQLVQLLVCVVDAKLSKRNSRRLWHTASCGIQRPVSRTSCVCRVCSARCVACSNEFSAKFSNPNRSSSPMFRVSTAAAPAHVQPRRTPAHALSSHTIAALYVRRSTDRSIGPRGCGCPRALVL